MRITRLWEDLLDEDEALVTVKSKRFDAASRLRWEILIDEDTAEGTTSEAARHQEALQGFYSGLRATDVLMQDETGGVGLLTRQILLDGLVRATERAGLHLISLIPVTAVLRSQLAILPGNDKEADLLVAEAGDMRTLIVGRRSGEILLVRSLDPGADPGAARLGVDLNRTLLFVSQQFGATIGSVWIFGTTEPERIAEIQAHVQIPVRASPEPARPLYWAEEAARLPVDRSLNLVGREQRKAPQRQTILRVTTVVTLALALAAAAALVSVRSLSRRQTAILRGLESQITTLQAEHQKAQRLHSELSLRENAVVTIMEDRIAPVPAWFLAYLGDATPVDLRLTEVRVRRDGDLWHLRLGGIPQVVQTNGDPSLTFSNAVASLTRKLQTGPFRVALAGNTNTTVADAIRSSAVRYGGIIPFEHPIAGDLTLPMHAVTQAAPATATVGTLNVH